MKNEKSEYDNSYFPEYSTIPELFEEQAKKTPNKPAIVFEDKVLHYAELSEKTNQLAHIIIKEYYTQWGEKVDSSTLIGIYLERSIEMIVGVLAILKAGAAYVPFDASESEDRLKFKIHDCGCRMILTSGYSVEDLLFKLDSDVLPVAIDSYWDEISKAPKAVYSECLSKPQDLAYVIYTSGSTGKPKGTKLAHKGIINLIYAQFNDLQLTENDKALQYSSISFDASVFEIFSTLAVGATLYIVPAYYRQDPNALFRFIQKNQISIATLPPAMLELFPKQEIPSLKTLIVAGDVCDPKTMQFWGKKLKLINAYGPTENSVCSTICVYNDATLHNDIGKTIQNVNAYILNKDLKPVQVGESGELYLGGAGLALGYLNREQLTASRFISNPFATDEDKKKGYTRLYKTGDLVSSLPNGNIKFLGRTDFQVKIRGFRVELGEIEAKLLDHPEIEQCIVTAIPLCKNDLHVSTEKVIAAYYKFSDKKNGIKPEKLRKNLSKVLPNYMIPTYFIELDKMPLNTSGKIDRHKLPVPSIGTLAENYIKPSSKIEKKLVYIWSKVLNVEKIGMNDDFFSLGGHSLKAAQLSSLIKKNYGIDLPVNFIFEKPAVKEMADFIEVQQISCSKVTAPVLKKVGAEDQYRYFLSPMQKGIWFYSQYSDSANIAYNVPLAFKLKGNLNIDFIEKAFARLAERHRILRTKFHERIDGSIVHKTANSYELDFSSEDAGDETIKNLINREIGKPFNLKESLPMRVILFKTGERRYLLIIVLHHIICDDRSLCILLDELEENYASLINKKQLKDKERSIDYYDFIIWQQKLLSDISLEKEKSYWKNKLENLPTLEMLSDFPRPRKQTFPGNCCTFVLSEKLMIPLKKICAETNTTLFMVLLAIFKIMLSRYSGQDDITVGTPIENRYENDDLEKVPGFFLSTLPLRTKFSQKWTFLDLLKDIKQTCLEAYANKNITAESLVNLLNIKRDLTRNPIFQILFTLQDLNTKDSLYLHDVECEKIAVKNNTSQFDLSFCLQKNNDELSCDTYYNTDLYKQETILRMIKNFTELTKNALTHPELPISSLSILSKEEKEKILHKWNKTDIEIPTTTLHELFEEQVLRNRNKNAVIFNNESITYFELNAKANQLADFLTSRFVKKLKADGNVRDIFIGICVKRSLDLIVGILAVIKTGCAYIPLDPETPQERIDFILNDAEVSVMLTQKQVLKKMPSISESHKVVIMDEHKNMFSEYSNKNIVSANPASLAYCVYTSGSTGNPKGVTIEHRSVVNLILDFKNKLNVSANDSLLSVTTFGFDIFNLELFLPLLSGATHILCPSELVYTPDKLTEYIHKCQPTIVQGTPAFWNILIGNIKNENYEFTAICGGENLSDDLAKKLTKKIRKVWNVYGPTETTIWSTCFDMTNYKCVTIGSACANTKLYVLDKNLSLVPIGATGELYIGGMGLARGYLKREELTRERFIYNPFATEYDKKQGYNRLYKTGDLVAWQSDGNLKFLGRTDFQVKIRGFRIETEEIEFALNKHPDILQSVVTGYTNDDQTQLAAYYIRNNEKANHISPKELTLFLCKTLPKYMLPATYIEIDEMPLNANGKINRKSLPKPDNTVGSCQTDYIEPKDEKEFEIQKIWESILKKQKISTTDDFFLLGGNSLLTVTLTSKINSHFNLEYPVSCFFKNTTIMEQANAVRQNKKSVHQPILSFNETERNTPLFFVPPVHIGAEAYIKMRNFLDKNQPFYIFESHNLNPDFPILKTVEELATVYINHLLELKPTGPYYLGGWCLGGLIAYEMAQQLLRQGHEVKNIYIMNAFAYDLEDKEEIFRWDIETTPEVFNRNSIFKDMHPKKLQKIKEVYSAGLNSIYQYKINPTNTNILLFKAQKDTPSDVQGYCNIVNKYQAKEDNGWSNYTKNIKIKPIDTDHFGLVKDFYLKQIAKHIQENILKGK